MNRKILEQKFELEDVKQRQGNYGQELSYIEGHVVVQRLIDATEGEFEFKIEKHVILDEEIIVQGSLKIDSVTKSQFGSSKITRAKDDNTQISLGDDIKAAATDCLKKCATLFGVGLHLYTDSIAQNNGTKSNSQTQHGSNITQSRISTKQFNYALKLAKEQGATKQELNTYCKQEYGVVAEHLNRDQASKLIDGLVNDKINLLDEKAA